MDEEELISLTEAAERLGVHYMTAYRHVRTGRLAASKKGGQWRVRPADLEPAAASPPTQTSRPRANYQPLVQSRLIAGDEAGTWALINEALAGGAEPSEVHRLMIIPSMANVGQLWADGQLSVLEEHRATATVHRVLGRMTPMFRHRGRRRGSIILGTVPGDSHSTPTALLADLLADQSFEVVDLGANTPAECFIGAAAELDDLVAVGICAMVSEHLDQLGQVALHLRSADLGAAVLGGGAAVSFASDEWLAQHLDGWSTDVDSALALFEAHSGKSPAQVAS